MARTTKIHKANEVDTDIYKGKTLQEKAMLVSLSISQWTAHKRDKVASSEVQQLNQAEHGTGNYWKKLSDHPAIKSASAMLAKARMYHYSVTLPWTDSGLRILPAALYLDYTAKMRQFTNEISNLVSDISNKMDEIKTIAERKQGKLYNEEDYPSQWEIKEKYSINISVYPLPDSKDFRVCLNQDEIAKIQSGMESKLNAAQDFATQDLYKRLYEKLNAVVAKLEEPDAIFRDTLIGNVKELTDILPKLNINDDEKLATLCKTVESKIANLNPQSLRDSTQERNKAAKEAQSILDNMAGYCGF